MTLYISAGRRRRRAVVAAVAVGVLALVLGLLIGRQQVPSVADRIHSVQNDAGQVATGLERLDTEYAKVVAGTDTLAGAVLAPIDSVISTAQRVLGDAPWITAQERAAIVDALTQTRASAEAMDTASVFDQHLKDTAALVRTTFGVSA
ncbi:MAG: hypothetical protein ABIR68_09185 [Ilumatobacteraceae bacterium]